MSAIQSGAKRAHFCLAERNAMIARFSSATVLLFSMLAKAESAAPAADQELQHTIENAPKRFFVPFCRLWMESVDSTTLSSSVHGWCLPCLSTLRTEYGQASRLQNTLSQKRT
jgi:hypothetical protein